LNEDKKTLTPQQLRSQQFKTVYSDLKKTSNQVNQVIGWTSDRYYWADVLAELRRVIIRVEEKTKTSLRTDTGVWIEILQAPPLAEGEAGAGLPPGALPPGGYPGGYPPPSGERMAPGRGNPESDAAPPPQPPPNTEQNPGGAPAGAAAPGAPGEISSCKVTFRAVSLTSISPSANTDIAFAVLNELKASPMFDADKTIFSGGLSQDEPPGTFTFPITVKLKQPLKL
jgi:hypothetical protein